jgi:AbrB family looped-hinge helix DNA binding protein
MLKSNMTIKGQVTVPRDVRRRLGLRPGQPVQFVENSHGETVICAAPVDDVAARKARREDAERRIAAVRAMKLKLDMPIDEFMAMIREPVPL